MTPDRFRQVRNLFDAVVERDPHTRRSFLEEACQGDESLCAEVAALLEAHGHAWAVLDVPIHPPEKTAVSASARMEGRRIGAYEILREIGSGGMGSVYLAARADDVFRKRVAIKLARPEVVSSGMLARFHQEREILAALDHPNIARVLDGGATEEGIPYFIMEYVEGSPIDSYCDEHKLGVGERVALFRQVCSAVEYAHGRDVIHRDLKPQNILVTDDGTVKLLDFGIAKLLRPLEPESTLAMTQTGGWLMTPEYASPEQVRGEAINRASDLYSLGVVLYELLTGHRPYHLQSRIYHEIVRVICEETPTRPSVSAIQPLIFWPPAHRRARASAPKKSAVRAAGRHVNYGSSLRAISTTFC